MPKPKHDDKLPDWKRPFENEDFQGFFTWGKDLTSRLQSRIFHACHEPEAKVILGEQRLGLRSTYSVNHPAYGVCSAPCVWCGLNFFNKGNWYGPLLFSFPLRRLEGRTFMVFWRKNARNRYWFVQYEAGIPVFSRDNQTDLRVDPASYFDVQSDDALFYKNNAIYELVLTAPMSLVGTELKAADHQPKCVSGKCCGMKKTEAQAIVESLGRGAIAEHLKKDDAIRRLLRRFPDLRGRQIQLPD